MNREGHHDSVIDVKNLAEKVGLPVAWVLNVFESDLLRERFPDQVMNAYLNGLQIHIPPTFSQRQT